MPDASPAARPATETAFRVPGEERWIAARLLPLGLGAIAIPILLVCLVGSLDWIGKPFPGFFVMRQRAIPTVALYDWPAMRAGVPFHSWVVAADGVPLESQAAVYDVARRRPVGTPVRWTFVKDGRTFDAVLPTMRFGVRDYWLTVGMFCVIGIGGLIAGLIVGLLRPRDPAARAFVLFNVLWGLFPPTGSALYHPDLSWLTNFHWTVQCLFPAAFMHLGLTFPAEFRSIQRRPGLVVLPYAVGGAFAVWCWATLSRVPPVLTAMYGAFVFSGCSLLFMLGCFVLAYWQNRTPLVRPRLRIVLFAYAIAGIAAAYAFFNTANDGGDLPTNLPAPTAFLMYGSFAYAIVKHDAFDIDAALRRTAQYVATTLAVVALYVATVVAFGLVVPTQAERPSRAFNLVVVAVVALAISPLRVRMQALVDRLFSRTPVDYRRTVSNVSTALTSLLRLDAILDRVGRTVFEAFELREAAVLLWLDDATGLWRHRAELGRMVRDPEAPDVGRIRGALDAHPGRPWLIGAATMPPDPALDAAVAALGPPALLVRIPAGDGSAGAFVLGPKRSGLGFSSEDVGLLDTLAAQTAIAVRNAVSYHALERLNATLESRVEERTAALHESNVELARANTELRSAQAQLVQQEKMASLGQLVAGVAHEINNPVSFIAGTIPVLRTRLAEAAANLAPDGREALRDAEELLEIMAHGATRTVSVVKDLRTFSRVDEGQRKVVDLHDAIEVTIRLLTPRWRDRITIVREYGALPPVECDPGQLNQVFMNLLANACDAIDGAGTIRVTTAVAGSDVVVAIADDGHGMPADVQARIFEPFFTTKDVGKGSGLGLAISHGVVVAHGGRIEVESAPGRGSTFRVVLPLAGSCA